MVPRPSRRGGLGGRESEAVEPLKWIVEAWREQLVLYTDFEAIVTRTGLPTPRCSWSRY